MKFILKNLIVVVILISAFSLSAQTLQSADQGPREDGTIEEQFDFLMEKGGKYKEYKVIKLDKLMKFKSNILDSMALVRASLNETRAKLKEKNNSIQSLNTQIENVQNDLSNTNKEKDNITLFGISMGKGMFKTFMGLIIAGLAGLLGMFIFRFRDSNVVTVETRKALAELQTDFEEHRKRSLEREQKAMRKLQDEINKRTGV